MSLPFDMGPGAALFMAAAFLVAAFVRGYSGFGFSALVVVAASLVTNPLHFVAVVMFCEFGMTFQQWRGVIGDVDWRKASALMAGALAGVPLGLWALTGVGIDAARVIISLYVIGMCAVMLTGWRFDRAVGTGAHLGVGVISGLANAPGMGGLPVASFFAAQGLPPAVFRATLIAYFALLDLYTAPLMWLHGMVGWDTIRAAALSVPIIALGIWAGGRHFVKTDPQSFRTMAIGLLLVLAVLGLVRAAQ